MVPDAVYSALDQLLPNMVPAEGAGCLCNFQVSLRPRTDAPAASSTRRAEVLTFNSGGSGARPTLDGMNATAFPSGVMTMPVEATEQVGPVIIWRKELRRDSGGAGQYRGGLGQHIEVSSAIAEDIMLFLSVERVGNPAKGRHGGLDGAKGRIRMGHDGADLPSKGEFRIKAGKTLIFETPGGGGFGLPQDRHPDALQNDVEADLVSPQAADKLYRKQP